MSVMGVAFASVSSGLGEMTFLSLTTQYHGVRQWKRERENRRREREIKKEKDK